MYAFWLQKPHNSHIILFDAKYVLSFLPNVNDSFSLLHCTSHLNSTQHKTPKRRQKYFCKSNCLPACLPRLCVVVLCCFALLWTSSENLIYVKTENGYRISHRVRPKLYDCVNIFQINIHTLFHDLFQGYLIIIVLVHTMWKRFCWAREGENVLLFVSYRRWRQEKKFDYNFDNAFVLLTST